MIRILLGCALFISISGVQSDSASLQRYFGAYKMKSGRFVYVRTWDELGQNQLTYFDSAGRAGALYPGSTNVFFAGTNLKDPSTKRIKVEFVDEKNGMKIIWKEMEMEAEEGKKLNDYNEEDVQFANADVRLAGTFFSPVSKEPCPAVVLIHGSGPVTRDFFGPIAYHFVRKGIAVLAYDKRGVGGSNRNWMESDFKDLARDFLAGVQFLKSRKEVDSRKIGLWGISQGGWIAPLAASLSNDIAFLILVSPAGVTPAEQQLQFMEAEARLAGIPEEKIQAQLQETRAQMESLRSENTREELEKEVQQMKQSNNQAALKNPGLDNPLYLLFYRKILDYEPLFPLEKINCPVLILYGELDATVPVQGNLHLVEKALKKSGNVDYKVLVLSRGNHALMEANTGSNSEFFSLKRFVPGFLNSMTDWIHEAVSQSS